MSEFVYATNHCWLVWGPNGTLITPGDKFRADDPMVLAHPSHFSETDPRDKVEQATAVPGERRNVNRSR